MNKGQVYTEGTPEDIFKLEEELIKLGLDIPFQIKMANALKDKGLGISKSYLTDEELVNELWTLHFSK